jgi:hypothetical protein
VGTQSSGAKVKPGAYEPCDSYPMQGNLKPNGITGRSKQVGGSDDSPGVAFFLSFRKKVLVQLLCLRSPCEMEMDFGWEPPFPRVLLAVPLIIPVESPLHVSPFTGLLFLSHI